MNFQPGGEISEQDAKVLARRCQDPALFEKKPPPEVQPKLVANFLLHLPRAPQKGVLKQRAGTVRESRKSTWCLRVKSCAKRRNKFLISAEVLDWQLKKKSDVLYSFLQHLRSSHMSGGNFS